MGSSHAPVLNNFNN